MEAKNYKQYIDLLKAQVRLMLSSETVEVLVWVDTVNQCYEKHLKDGQPISKMTVDYLEMGLKTCIVNQRVKVGQQMVDNIISLGAILLDITVSILLQKKT